MLFLEYAHLIQLSTTLIWILYDRFSIGDVNVCKKNLHRNTVKMVVFHNTQAGQCFTVAC